MADLSFEDINAIAEPAQKILADGRRMGPPMGDYETKLRHDAAVIALLCDIAVSLKRLNGEP